MYYRPDISAVRSLPVPYVMGLCCFYTLHCVSLCQLFKLNDDDESSGMLLTAFIHCNHCYV